MSSPYKNKLYPAPRVELLKKPISPDHVIMNILSYMAIKQEQVMLADKVHRVMNGWNNRKVNVRIQKEIERAIGDKYNVWYGKPSHDQRRVEVTIWSRDPDHYLSYEGRMMFTLAEADHDFIMTDERSHEATSKYIERNVEEIAKLQTKFREVSDLVEAYNKMLPLMQKALNDMADILPFAFVSERGY